MAGSKVGDMFMSLALIPDLKSWSMGQAAVDQMTGHLKSLAVSAGLATMDVKKASSAIGLELPKVRSNWDKIKTSGDGVSSTFWRMAAAALAFVSAAKIEGLVKSTLELGGVINTTAQKTGLSAEALQKWGYAARLNGSSIDDVSHAAVHLSASLASTADAAKKTGTSSGPLVDGLKALGISMNDPAVKSRNLDQILFLVSNSLSRMPDGAIKTAAAINVLGKSGAALIPALNGGVRATTAANKAFDEMGAVMSGGDAAALDGVGSKIDTAKIALEGLRNQAVITLLPVLEKMIDRFQAWVTANQDLIKSTLKDVVEGLATALSAMGTALAFVVAHWKVFAAIVAGAALISGLTKVIRLIIWFQAASTAAAVEAVIAWIAILGPILLIGIAIAALGILIYKFRDQIWEAIKAIGQWFADVGTAIWDAISGALNSVADAASTAWDAIKDGFKKAFDWIAELPVIKQLIGLMADIRDFVGTTSPNAVKPTSDQSASANSGSESDALFGPSGMYSGATGPAGPAGAAPSRPSSSVQQAVAQVSNSYSIMINAANADAAQVATLVDDKIREHDERTRRETGAALGVGAQ